MTTDRQTHLDRDLDPFFSDLRNERAEPTPDLLARVLADAYALQDEAASVVGPENAGSDAPGRGMLGTLLDALGGWPAIAGLATAVVAGVWIGLNPPAVFDGLSQTFLDASYGVTMNTSLPDYTYMMADG